ncbi:Hypothetical protein HDN1F_14120 [gamma proteobacterium HdN1]|nr:Hypothetical protein HDN1F_14120 [gamma proteobacterium HdN1]
MVLRSTRMDKQTSQFVDNLWASFERFDLRKFYEMLPEKEGDWRYLKVNGLVNDGYFDVGAPTAATSSVGFPNDFGQLAIQVKARENKGDRTTYLVDSKVQVGMGSVTWPAVSNAVEQTLRIVVKGDKAFTEGRAASELSQYRERVQAMNAGLGKEDVEVLAPLWAAFPAQWDLLASIGQFDDVVMEDVAGADYKKLNATFVVDPNRMSKRYPALAKHMAEFASLNKSDIRAVSEQGDVFHLSIDSEKLMGRFEAYVKDGYLVPVKNGKEVGEPLVGMFAKPWHLDLVGESRMDILGVITDMRNLKLSLDFAPQTGGAKTVASLRTMPEVTVSGRALGLIPTGFIDAFMPSNIESVMQEFLQVLCEGNDGRGLVASMEFRQPATGGLATLETHTTFEGLNNFFVQFGMGIVNHRLVPNPDVSRDLRRLLFDTQQAFSVDLETFSRVAAL